MSAWTKIGIGAVTLLASFATVSCGDAGDPDASPNDAGNAAASAEPAADKDCPYVEAEPTYLPWVPEGEEVPEPQRNVADGTSYVAWTGGSGEGPEQKSVVLRRSSEPLGGTGEPVSVELEGAPGYYYDGPGPQGAVLWKTEAETCGLITLTLSLPRANEAELREELLEVAESLES